MEDRISKKKRGRIVYRKKTIEQRLSENGMRKNREGNLWLWYVKVEREEVLKTGARVRIAIQGREIYTHVRER